MINTRTSYAAALLLLSAVSTTTTFGFSPSLQRQRQAATRTALYEKKESPKNDKNGGKNGRDEKEREPYYEKSADRAFVEKRLEDAMDNDWRVFRAKLVAQERLEEQEAKRRKENPTAPSTVKPLYTNYDANTQKELNKNGQLGEMFAGAISSIFNKNKDDSTKSSAENKDGKDGDNKNEPEEKHRRFDGETIGTFADVLSKCEDPFVSESEIPLLLESKVKIDKARWAHAIPHVEPGCVLVANEKLGGVFHQTVVLVIDHSETQGSTGMIINRPLEEDLETLALKEGRKTKVDLSLKLAFQRSPVTYGGPVNADEYSILHGFGEVEGSRKLATGVFVGGSEELMMEVRIGRLRAKDVLFVKGHAAWVGGQLDREIAKGVWYPAAVSSDMLLRYAGGTVREDDEYIGDLWADILTCMGGAYTKKAQENAGRGDRRVMP